MLISPLASTNSVTKMMKTAPRRRKGRDCRETGDSVNITNAIAVAVLVTGLCSLAAYGKPQDEQTIREVDAARFTP